MHPVSRKKRKLIEGRPALIVIDIQAETFFDRTDEAIPTMPGYAERMTKARVAIDKAREQDIPVIFIQEVHRADLVDFGRELDGSEDVHCIETNPGTDFPQVIRGISAPGNDVIETITIDKEYIHTIRSISNYFSISRYKIVDNTENAS